MSFRSGSGGWGYGSGNGNGGLSRQTAIIAAGVVVGVVVVGLALCCLCRHRKHKNRFKNTTPPRLPTHMSQLPPPPAAYIRPISTRDLPAYHPPETAPHTSGPHAAWAAPAPPYQPRSPPALPKEPHASAYPSNRRSIFRRPVPPLHTSDDLAPPPSPSLGAQPQVLPQVTPYDVRRGERPFGPTGLDGRHPGVPESDAGSVGVERSQGVDTGPDAPPGYSEASGRM